MASKTAAKPVPTRARVKDADDAVEESSERPLELDEATAPSSPVVIRSEGQRMLLEVGESLATIGRAVGASKQTVAYWRSGTYTPDKAFRAALEKRYRIPMQAWRGLRDEVDDEDEEGDDDVSVTADLDRLLRTLRKQLRRDDLTAREQVQVTEAFGRAVLQKARIEKDREMLEDRTIREHPKWKRFKRALIETLLPFPEAARAVEALCIRLLGEEDAEETGSDVD